MNKPEVTANEVLRHMKDDAAMIEQVAQIVSMNREACALLAKQIAKDEDKREVSDAVAGHMARLVFLILEAFAHDMREAIEAAESGTKEVRLVEISGGTKH